MGWTGGTGRMGRELCPPAYPGRPAYPARLETHLESQLELPLLVPRRIHELIRVGWNHRRTGRTASRVGNDLRVDAGELLGVEHVLQLSDDFASDRPGNRNPARIAQVDVLARCEIERVAVDEQRPIAGDAV